MSMKILAVVTQLSIYHGCYTWKTFWEEHFTPSEFAPAKIKNCGCYNFRKHMEIKNGENYITLDISLTFGSLDNMIITSSEPEYY